MLDKAEAMSAKYKFLNNSFENRLDIYFYNYFISKYQGTIG